MQQYGHHYVSIANIIQFTKLETVIIFIASGIPV